MNELLFITQTLFLSLLALISVRVSYGAALCFTILMSILSNLFVTKQIILFGWHATCSDAFITASSTVFNMMQRHYGPQPARHALILNSAASMLYALLAWCYMMYIPVNTVLQNSAESLLGTTPRIIGASLISFAISGYLDYSLFGWLQIRYANRYPTLINALSIGVCQAVDTVLFSLLGLYGIMSHLYEIIWVSYALKCFALFMACPLIYLFNYFTPDNV